MPVNTFSHFPSPGAHFIAAVNPALCACPPFTRARIEQFFFANSCQQAAQIGFDDQFIYKELSLPHTRKQLSISQLSDDSVLEKAAAVFQKWSNSEFKQTY